MPARPCPSRWCSFYHPILPFESVLNEHSYLLRNYTQRLMLRSWTKPLRRYRHLPTGPIVLDGSSTWASSHPPWTVSSPAHWAVQSCRSLNLSLHLGPKPSSFDGILACPSTNPFERRHHVGTEPRPVGRFPLSRTGRSTTCRHHRLGIG